MKRIFMTLIAATFSMVITSCSNSNAASKVKKENVLKAKKRDEAISKGAPVASFDKKEFDFGTIKSGDVVKTSFMLTNKGKTDLVITDAKTTCGCTVPQWPKKPIAPGKTAEIKVKFNSAGKRGKQSKAVTLFTNTGNGREVVKLVGFVSVGKSKEPKLKDLVNNKNLKLK